MKDANNNKEATLLAHNITVKVANRATPVLEHVNIEIFSEEFVVILGHNGSGKSTLIKALSGNIQPTFGYVKIDNYDINVLSNTEKAKEIITLTQRVEDCLFEELTLRENILLWESRYNTHERMQSENIFSLIHQQKKFLKHLDHLVQNFSGGEKQTILLALALAHPPRILFLDEHTSALDPKASEEVMKMTSDAIKEHKITAIMVTHDLEDALKYGNRLVIMSHGKIVIDQKKTPDLTINKLKNLMEEFY